MYYITYQYFTLDTNIKFASTEDRTRVACVTGGTLPKELSRQHIPVLRILDVYPESLIPDPGSDFFPSRIRPVSIPDPGSALENLGILTPKKQKMVSKL